MTSIQPGIFDYRIYDSPMARRTAPTTPEDFARLAGAGAGAEAGTPSDSPAATTPAPDSIAPDSPIPAPLSPQILATLFQFQEAVGLEESEEQTDPEEPGSVEEEFLDYMSKSPEERYAEALLRELGLTPEQLAALPPEERNAILEKIQQKIEAKIEEDMLNPAG